MMSAPPASPAWRVRLPTLWPMISTINTRPWEVRRGMDTVNGVRRDVHRALETERHICTVDIIVNGLGKMDDIQPLSSSEDWRSSGFRFLPGSQGSRGRAYNMSASWPPPCPDPSHPHAHELKGWREVPRMVPPCVRDTGKIPGGEHTVFP